MTSELSPEIHRAISVPRLGKYLALVGNSSLEDALLLYRLNAKLSGTFIFPLQSMEVALRNALASQLDAYFGASDWLINPAIPFDHRVWSGRQIEKIQKATSRLQEGKRRPPTQNDMISDLELGFWTELVDKTDGRHRLWSCIKGAFPNLPPPAKRGPVFFALNRLRKLRNRIAHHEPIVGPAANPIDAHSLAIAVIGWISRDKAAWTQKYSQVGEVWKEISDEKHDRGWLGF